jgi:hypothetical protein
MVMAAHGHDSSQLKIAAKTAKLSFVRCRPVSLSPKQLAALMKIKESCGYIMVCSLSLELFTSSKGGV